jgi:hypothetical protein
VRRLKTENKVVKQWFEVYGPLGIARVHDMMRRNNLRCAPKKRRLKEEKQ